MAFLSLPSTFCWKSFLKEEMRYSGQILCCSLFLSLSGQFFLPYYPIPATLQTLCFMVLGFFFKPQALFMGSLFWLSLGLLGLPIFSGLQGGFFVVLGVKGGYIMSMILGAPLLGKALQTLKTMDFSKGRKFFLSFFLCLTFSFFVLTLGSLFFGFLSQNYSEGFLLGAAPFLLAEIIKSFGASLLFFKK